MESNKVKTLKSGNRISVDNLSVSIRTKLRHYTIVINYDC